MFPSPSFIALILGVCLTFGWLAILVWLPFAMRDGQVRLWLRDAGFAVYLTVLGAACIVAAFYMQSHGWWR